MSDGVTLSTTASTRRRNKPQLSCNACRRRKVRCDRLHPCSNCASRGLGSSCMFAAAPIAEEPGTDRVNDSASTPNQAANSGTAANMQTRINQLENLVLSLMHQTTPSPRPIPLQEQQLSPQPQLAYTPSNSESQFPVSPSPSDYGSISIRQARSRYVGSSHWAAVLDSITELRHHFAQEEDTVHRDSEPALPLLSFPRPQLLYSGITYETPASIIHSVPPRAIVDRLVSRYFNVLDIAPGVVHSTKFLREYEEFWKVPQDAPVMWVGLLFGMMCLSAQLQQASLSPTESIQNKKNLNSFEHTIETYRTKAIQCLLLGHYTKGGPYVLETLILYFLSECFNLKDMEIGVWMLAGTIVQVATHMGYHRDSKHFSHISPFIGEMRRRAWAMIVQLDFGISTQLGLPQLIKKSQTDTEEPRNLNDSDLDEDMSELPPSRPETEITPTLYVLAKLRLFSVGTKVADVVTESRIHSYNDVLELDRQIQEARVTLPSSLRWTGLGTCLNVSSQIIVQRIWLEVTVQQLTIVLHKKFLDASRLQQNYRSSKAACLKAAMEILDMQRLIDEETQEGGLLYQSRWRVSSAFSHNFLLGTSILCFCVQMHMNKQKQNIKDSEEIEFEPEELDKIRQRLQASQRIWNRQSADSKEAQKAVAALRYVLNNAGTESASRAADETCSMATSTTIVPSFSDFTSNYDLFSLELELGDQAATWPLFANNINDGVEQWARGFQQMEF